MNKVSEAALSQGFLPVLPYNIEISTVQQVSSISMWFATWHAAQGGKSHLLLHHAFTQAEWGLLFHRAEFLYQMQDTIPLQHSCKCVPLCAVCLALMVTVCHLLTKVDKPQASQILLQLTSDAHTRSIWLCCALTSRNFNRLFPPI